jgi:hypothetical protein
VSQILRSSFGPKGMDKMMVRVRVLSGPCLFQSTAARFGQSIDWIGWMDVLDSIRLVRFD